MSKINELITALQTFQNKAVTLSQESSLSFFKIFTDFKFFDDSSTLLFIDLKTEEEMSINIDAIKSIDIDNEFITLLMDKELKVEITKEDLR